MPKFSRTLGEVEFLGPRHGEHNMEVYLDELGISVEEYVVLEEDGII